MLERDRRRRWRGNDRRRGREREERRGLGEREETDGERGEKEINKQENFSHISSVPWQICHGTVQCWKKNTISHIC